MASPAPLMYHILYARTKTELHLTEKESTKAKQEMFTLLERMLADLHSPLVVPRTKVDIYDLSDRFSSQQLNEVVNSKNAEGLNGALLSRIVELINKKKLFGEIEGLIGFEKCLFEIYDSSVEDFVVLVNRDSPVPADATIRIKMNHIQDVFSYDSALEEVPPTQAPARCLSAASEENLSNSLKKQLVVKDEVKSEDVSETLVKSGVMSSKSGENPRAAKRSSEASQTRPMQKQPRRGGFGGGPGAAGNRSGRVYAFSKSYEPSGGYRAVTEEKVDQDREQGPASGPGNEPSRGRGRGRGRFARGRRSKWQKDDEASGQMGQQNPSYLRKFQPMSRAQIFLFKDILKALRNETLLRQIDRDSRSLNRLLERKKPDNPAAWFQQRLIESIWTTVVTHVASPPKLAEAAPDPFYLVAKYQQLYHLAVCVRYLGAMKRANSYLEASMVFDLFNYIHGKVMGVYYLLEDMRIGTRCICGICGIDSTAIIVARNAFRDKQVELVKAQMAVQGSSEVQNTAEVKGEEGPSEAQNPSEAQDQPEIVQHPIQETPVIARDPSEADDTLEVAQSPSKYQDIPVVDQSPSNYQDIPEVPQSPSNYQDIPVVDQSPSVVENQPEVAPNASDAQAHHLEAPTFVEAAAQEPVDPQTTFYDEQFPAIEQSPN